jgi:bifunctional DNA-binding transcriptional regulator/antitoxin component of YhaV-PrlF toxin-antitoxin module
VSAPAAKIEPRPRISARAKIRAEAHLTLPDAIMRVMGIGEGDEVEFSVHDDGTITVRGYVPSPPIRRGSSPPAGSLVSGRLTRTSPLAGEHRTSSPRACSLILTRSARRVADARIPDSSSFERDWKGLTSKQQALFRKMVLDAFVPDLMAWGPPVPATLACKGVTAHPGVLEMTDTERYVSLGSPHRWVAAC